MILGLTRIVSEFMLSPRSASTAIALLIYVPLAHKYGFAIPQGGSGRLSECLAACIMVDYLRTFDDLQYGIPNTREPLLMCPTVFYGHL